MHQDNIIVPYPKHFLSIIFSTGLITLYTHLERHSNIVILIITLHYLFVCNLLFL